ncbi:hypothetical protein ACHAQH_004083 [Verticillium albo-atrum]
MRLHSALLVAATASVIAESPWSKVLETPGSPLVDPPQPLAQQARTKYVNLNGTKVAYRRFGKPIHNPIIYLTHLRGDMDNIDPLLFNYIAQYCEVIMFDNPGVGHSEGAVQDTVEAMGDATVSFLQALEVSKVVSLGFSLGGLIAQYLSWTYPDLIERAVFAAATVPRDPTLEDYLFLLFDPSETSQAAGREWFQRRPDRRVKGETISPFLGEAGITAQAKVIIGFASNPDNFARLQDVNTTVLIPNGHTDVMLPTVNSFILQQQLPYPYLDISPDSGHGHLFQFPKAYAEALETFLSY